MSIYRRLNRSILFVERENETGQTRRSVDKVDYWGRLADYARSKRGRPLGDAKWTTKTAKEIDLEFTLRPRGRPKKEKETRNDSWHLNYSWRGTTINH